MAKINLLGGLLVDDVVRLYRGVFHVTYGNIDRNLLYLMNKFGATDSITNSNKNSIKLYKKICDLKKV